MKVVKNTLAKRALKSAGIRGLDSFFVGPTGVVWSKEDSILPAKVLLDFVKKHEKGSVKAGLVDGTVFKENEIETISNLPSKQELYAHIASVLNTPIIKLAQVLNGIPVKFVRTVDALREKRAHEVS
jgi:large subunit ribosomal protein L10